MSEFVETKDGRLINVAHIVTAEWRNGEWRLRLSDGRDAYYRGESFGAMNFNDALDKLTTSHQRATTPNFGAPETSEAGHSRSEAAIQEEDAIPAD